MDVGDGGRLSRQRDLGSREDRDGLTRSTRGPAALPTTTPQPIDSKHKTPNYAALRRYAIAGATLDCEPRRGTWPGPTTGQAGTMPAPCCARPSWDPVTCGVLGVLVTPVSGGVVHHLLKDAFARCGVVKASFAKSAGAHQLAESHLHHVLVDKGHLQPAMNHPTSNQSHRVHTSTRERWRAQQGQASFPPARSWPCPGAARGSESRVAPAIGEADAKRP